MLYMKNLLFVDNAIATLAPDLNLFGEVGRIYGYFVQNHSDQILKDVGLDPRSVSIDLDGVRRQLGVEDDVENLSHRDLQERRRVVQERLRKARDRKADLDARLASLRASLRLATVAQLRELCARCGVASAGAKADIRVRLEQRAPSGLLEREVRRVCGDAT